MDSRLARFMAVVGVLVGIGGCQTLDDYKTLQGYYGGGGGKGNEVVPPGELHNFIVGVAANKTTQTSNIDGRQVRGVYVGGSGCAGVAVIRSETQSGRSEDLRAEDYRVCGSKVTHITQGVAPSYPDTKDAKTALTNAQQNALLYGSQSVLFGSYVINTRRIGLVPASTNPCMPVETVIGYEGRLVLQNLTTICQSQAVSSYQNPSRK